jgi:uncharacterized protein YndB with AHSA1/START domain
VRIPGDEATVTVLVAVEPAVAFRIFTEEIDQWWRRGPQFRLHPGKGSVVRLEPGVGGRLLESAETPRIYEAGAVTAWEPPSRLVFEWRAVNFDPSEKTEVEVLFTPSKSGTQVTVKHRGWSRIRADHPARHGHDVPAFIRMMGLWWGELMTSLRQYVDRERPTS